MLNHTRCVSYLADLPARRCLTILVFICLLNFCPFSNWFVSAQVPGLLNYQGRIAVGSTAFDGMGQFKLALVNNDASQIFWANAPDNNNDGQPDSAVEIAVTQGLYSLPLGDTSIPNMSGLPASVFSNTEVYLRVWFNDGTNGFQLLSPDQRITSVGYAMMSGNVVDGAIGEQNLNPGLTSIISTLNQQITILTDRLQQLENRAGEGLTVVSPMAQDPDLIAKGFQSFYSLPPTSWESPVSNGQPSGRWAHSVVWTGQSVAVWGGFFGGNQYSNTGGLFDPGQNAWTTITTFNAPSSRQSHGAVWSGAEMIIWGGLGSGGYLRTGARFIPSSQSWSAVTTGGAPSARSDHACLWTGSRMLVWGGRSTSGFLNDGGLYNPTANQWTVLPVENAPAGRHSAGSVWTRGGLIVWGGHAATGPTRTGGFLSFDLNGDPQNWTPTATANAPSARVGHTAVWTGEKLIIWGGRNGSTFFSDGAIYDPSSNTWTPLPAEGAPSERSGHTAVWTGQEMLVFFGETASGPLASGGAYDPVTNLWRPLSGAGNPAARSLAKGVWSNNEWIVFGGRTPGGPVASLQILDPRPNWFFYRKL